MRFRHCLGAMLLLAVSAPAMADMYLFDGRAWTAGYRQETALRERTSENGQGRIAGAISADPASNLPTVKFVDWFQVSLTGCSLQRELRLAPASARCE